MGSLMQMPYSEVTATLEALTQNGVNEDDFKQLRKYPVFRKALAEILRKPQELIALALGSNEEDAVAAAKALIDFMQQLGAIDGKMLHDICMLSPFQEVSLAVLELAAETYEVARRHPNMRVVEAAAMKLYLNDDENRFQLTMLCSDYYVPDPRRRAVCQRVLDHFSKEEKKK